MRANMHKKKKVFKLAKGFRGRAKNCYRIAKPRVMKALQHAYRDRRRRKRDFRRLWVQQLSAAAKSEHMNYSQLIYGLKLANVGIDRKCLAEIARTEPASFRAVVITAQNALELKRVNEERSAEARTLAL